MTMIARAWQARRFTDNRGLTCLRCDDFFSSALAFIKHSCYLRLIEEKRRAEILMSCASGKPAPGPATLLGEQLSFEVIYESPNASDRPSDPASV
jgi:hypothetical protein